MPAILALAAIAILQVGTLAFSLMPAPDQADTLGGPPGVFIPTGSGPQYAIGGMSDGCAEWSSSVLTSSGVACGGGSGGISTSTNGVAGQLAWWTGTASLGTVATTSLTASSPLSLSQPISVIGGSASALSIDTSGAWTGNAGTASALAANGGNCSAGSAPLGVDASGVVESCFDVWTESENTSAAYFPLATWYATTSKPNLSITESQISDLAHYTDSDTATYILASSTLCTTLTGSADLCDGIDNTSGGAGLATSTAIADTYVIYGTSASTVGAESAFTYDDALNKLTVSYASTTNVSATMFSGALTGNVTGNLTGTASLASALAANGANCDAGQSPLGVDASGAVESCFDVWTESENTSAAYLNAAGVNSYIHSSSTIPKTYTDNTFTGKQTITNASTTNASVTGYFSLLGDLITNVATWIQGKIDAYLSGGEGITYSSGAISFDCSEVTDSANDGLTCSTENLVVDDVLPAQLASSDFGDMTCNGTTCALDANTVETGEIADDTITHADIADSDQASTMCIYFEDPTADDDFKSIWANKTANDFLLTELWAESDQTVNLDLQVDDGSPADVNGTDISPAAGEAEDTSLSGDTTVAAGEELDLAITSVSGTPTWVSICWTGNWVD